MDKKLRILNAAIAIAAESNLLNVTRDKVAEYAGVGQGTINYHYGNIDVLRDAVIRHAIKNETMLHVIAQAVLDKNHVAKKASSKLKKKAFSEAVK